MNVVAGPFRSMDDLMDDLQPQRYMAKLLAAHQAEDAFEPAMDEPPAIDEEGC